MLPHTEPHARLPAPQGLDAIVLMGVAGSGKTTVGKRLSKRLRWTFRDADSFHPEANIAKMSAGTPLCDDDRWPWLDAIGSWIDASRAMGEPVIVSCSALKRIYRAHLLAGRGGVRIVYLKGDRDLIAARMTRRRNHFMPTALLDSQFTTLEEPTPDERALIVPVRLSPPRVLAVICEGLGIAT